MELVTRLDEYVTAQDIISPPYKSLQIHGLNNGKSKILKLDLE